MTLITDILLKYLELNTNLDNSNKINSHNEDILWCRV